MKPLILLTALLGLTVGIVSAQTLPPPLPTRGPAPLLYVRFQGPEGLKVTLYSGPSSKELKLPATVGLRPGYSYRVKVIGFKHRPGIAMFPSIEVYGTLQLAPQLNPEKFPAPIVFNVNDVERTLEGTMLTKVVYLEDPRLADKESPIPGEPLETLVSPTANLLKESLQRGRPMLVTRMGNRGFSEQELAGMSLPGTILLPGQQQLGQPPRNPPLLWRKIPLYDPILGPRHYSEECLFDGGDREPKLGYNLDGDLINFDPEDTIAEYRDRQGRRRVAVSNRICLCVPRYGVLRVEKPLRSYAGLTQLGKTQKLRTQVQIESGSKLLENRKYNSVIISQARRRPSESRVTTEIFSVRKLLISNGLATGMRLKDVTSSKQPPPKEVERPLVLKKWADRKSAAIGDRVTIYLKYSNPGDFAMTDVVVSDSLTNRLVYVPGTAQSSRNAVFTTQLNESGSAIVRWEITGRLDPGESGIVSFQVRVR